MDEIIGATVKAQDPVGSDADAKALLSAQLETFKKAETPPTVPPAAAPVEPQAQPKAEKPQPTEAQAKPDKEGIIDPQISKEEKVNESLKRKTEDKEARIQSLLKQREELKKEFYKTSEKAAALEKAPPPTPQEFRGLTPELKKQVLSQLESDPVDGVFKTAEMVIEARLGPILDELAQLRQETMTRREVERLDSLGQAGHSWVYTDDGQRWFQEKFQEEPGLLRMSDPYGAAVKMFGDTIPSQSAQQTPPAQGVKGTPVLGVSSAVPPPSSAPTATPEKKLADLTHALHKAMAVGDWKEATRIGLEQKKYQAGMNILA